MTLIAAVAAAALAATLIWTIGPLTARILGALTVLAALTSLTLGASGDWVLYGVLGAALWLVGHWLTAYKTGAWRSRIAESAFKRSPLRTLKPPKRRRRKSRSRRHLPTGARPSTRHPRRRPSGQPNGATPVPPTVDDFVLWEREIVADRPHHERRN
ncbi:hypothetical protein [Nocardia farcinica]|uniref:hypothetical protein n=1 Tax=Nocardia farcinica TaxID=37329 RepID=UPI0024540557|nr:hypothetical protein [Nocardia farcinica]